MYLQYFFSDIYRFWKNAHKKKKKKKKKRVLNGGKVPSCTIEVSYT